MQLPLPKDIRTESWLRKWSKPSLSERRRRLRFGLLYLLIGLTAGAFGFYDLSIWNTAGSHSYGVPLFVLGGVSVILSLIYFIAAAPELLGSGDRGI